MMIQSRRVYGDQKEEFELGVLIDCVRSKRRRSITGEATCSRVQVGGSPESGNGGRGGKGDMASHTDAATTLDWLGFLSWIFVVLSTREGKAQEYNP
jgi:hypothetical protein